ncbi:alpha beta-hydrolase [Lecanosticta acicola]|uniref:Alpha beta-hydrolase n=1 Tax=Lecanosticta acicola TaxID=111012 RepID=A0AAI8W1L6_9PEZI|nr:alpha beta-hydrolase [Lecanosticta acicola]
MRAFRATRDGLRSRCDPTLSTRTGAFRSQSIRASPFNWQNTVQRHRPCNDCVYKRLVLQRRTFITDGLPAFLVPPVIFTSLLVGLWTYKCMMTVLFQDRIIYMPYMPPFARSEKMKDYTAVCKPVEWEHTHIKSLDGTRIALCVGEIPANQAEQIAQDRKRKHVIICYFQGNGSSLPPRLPLMSNVLKSIKAQVSASSEAVRYTLVALSYRGYWTSSGRASQSGIELDAQAMLRWINATYRSPNTDLELILWGQSIGAGVASTAAAAYIKAIQKDPLSPIAGIVLETPFSGIKSMLLALYPQKWLPYRYLWPFLWNHWDSEIALRGIANTGHKPMVLLLPATRDEVVPHCEADKLEAICRDAGLPTERRDIIGALHTEATTRREGQDAVARFIVECAASR